VHEQAQHVRRVGVARRVDQVRQHEQRQTGPPTIESGSSQMRVGPGKRVAMRSSERSDHTESTEIGRRAPRLAFPISGNAV